MAEPAAAPRSPAEIAAFIRTNTVVATPPIVPEVRLHLATEVTPLWQASESLLQEEHLPPPFWAFAWPGGQAVARYLLDHPETVRGHTVLDLGSGSGLVAIAAAMAGAARVVAIDMDAFACAAIGLNAALNGVAVDRARRDATAWDDPPGDVVVAGDVCYERAVADRIARWLRRRFEGGAAVLLGDPGRTYLPNSGLHRIAAYTVPTSRELESGDSREAVVWRMA
ncbi:MAG: class I SAM-dependent methyltransferase [Alphaproteobacteria bacterium]